MPQKEDLRIRLGPKLKAAMDRALADRVTTQQGGVARLIEWFVDQDPVVQAAILGQIPMDDDVKGLMVDRMMGKGKRRR